MTDEEYLEHYGIPGMRWGHRKLVRAGGDNTRAAKQFAKKTTSDDVKKARARVSKEVSKVQVQKLKYKEAKRVARKSENGKAVAERELAKYNAMKKEVFRNPDRATAFRLTKGEKVAIGIAGLVLTPAVAGITVGARVGTRKMIESKAVREELKAKGKLK